MTPELITPTNTGFGQGGALCEMAGNTVYNEMVRKNTILEEDLTTSNTGALFVTLLRGMIRQTPAPQTFIKQIFDIDTSMKNTWGGGAIKLPINKLARATLQGEGAKVEYETDGYTSITVNPQLYASASALTRTILQFAGPGTIANEAKRMNRAVELAVEYYGIAALDAACSSSNANSHDNEIKTGSGSTDMDWADICDAQEAIETYHGQATDLIIHPADYQALRQDSDFKLATEYSANLNRPKEVMGRWEYVAGMNVWITAYETDGKAHLIDRNNIGSFVEASDIEVADIPIGDSFNRAVGAYQFFGFGVENEDMVAEIYKSA